LPFYI